MNLYKLQEKALKLLYADKTSKTKDAIKAELKRLDAGKMNYRLGFKIYNISNLKPEQYPAFMEFLKTL